MEVTRTPRGFELIEFVDENGETCHLQQSSVIGDYADAFDRPGSSAVWLGTSRKRMHLSREQVREVVDHLARWMETGSLDAPAGEVAP